MAIQLGDVISASEMNTYLVNKGAALHWKKTGIQGTGGGNTYQYTFWVRDRDTGYPHAVGETSHGLWVGGTTYAVGDTVLGKKRTDGLSDGIIWVCSVAGTAQRPGELGDDGSAVNRVSEWLPQQGWNYQWDFDMGGRDVDEIDMVKQTWNGSAWVDDYFVTSTGWVTPWYLQPIGNKWPGEHGTIYLWLPPGRYRTRIRNTFAGLGRSDMYAYFKPWQRDMIEDEYIRTYTSDRSDFIPALITIGNGTNGLLGSTPGIVDDPPGGNSG